MGLAMAGLTWNLRSSLHLLALAISDSIALMKALYCGIRAYDKKGHKTSQRLVLRTKNGGEIWEDISAGFNELKSVGDRRSKTTYMNDTADNILFIDPKRIQVVTFSRKGVRSW